VIYSRFKKTLIVIGLCLSTATQSLAVDPPYQQEMERLANIMGALYHLDELCLNSTIDWRQEFADLMELDEVDEDRQERLTAAFNNGYLDFSRLHVRCTANAETVTRRFVVEGAEITKNIHTRFAE